ncbi:MAG: Fe-S-containing protein [Planctomycetaceae bacterium]|jgi:transposase-like protein|nr:Fe-S-containing protein [Planctomycetaceae bacterium]
MQEQSKPSVVLTCSTCQGDTFESSENWITCQNCKRTFTFQQLESANKTKINAALESAKTDPHNDMTYGIQRILRISFGKDFKIE